ncbi:MAG: hypothetical protein QM813_03615 [Verrucomicrobiota bacterium]
MAAPNPNYRQLDPQEIVATVRMLQDRIEGRFPGSGLSKVASELLHVAQENVTRTEWIQKPHFPLRLTAAILSLVVIALLTGMLLHIRQFKIDDYTNFIQSLEASISSVVFVGAAILFFVGWENRIKRNRALKAIHELRALAHIVDMHQLTKHPESCFARPATTPKRALTPFELNRYLDYCSESLALISKIATLYVQGFQDTVLLDAVDDVEDLTAGLSRKIWQKITILENLGRLLPAPVSPTERDDPPNLPPT